MTFVKCECSYRCWKLFELSRQLCLQSRRKHNSSNSDETLHRNDGYSFKERYRNHTKSFADKKYSNETELSKYVWERKNGPSI